MFLALKCSLFDTLFHLVPPTLNPVVRPHAAEVFMITFVVNVLDTLENPKQAPAFTQIFIDVLSRAY